MQPADRCNAITPFIVMEILEKIQKMEAQGIDVIHMEIGQPDFKVPECVNQATMEALAANETNYTHSLGDIRLRQAISDYHKTTYHTIIDPGRILVTSGTSPAMLLLFSALVNPGDEIIISDPHYACYANFINYVQGIPVTVPVFEKEGFIYTPEAIEEKITSKTRAIFINSPSNPTGSVIPEKRMRQIADIADAHGLYVISDEIYHGLVYEGKEHSIFEFTDKAFLLNGFSKLFAMTGLRLGYLIAPPEYIRALQVLQQNFFICANSIAQLAGAAVLKNAGQDTAKMREIYNKRRRYVIDRLRNMGFRIDVEPTGAFYVFVNATHISQDSYALALDILENAHVGVTPGIDFGKNGEGYLRFSYANSMENLKTGLDRLEGYLKTK
ncbi:MAG: pyridoxal phosphate-dependent aminotransferase [Proteobacteria bacterium]|nr:pyridoxal phosphate-dependent aminotransferase [Pseudomonadota bacterium]MBU1387952.1 pyridoxal phosphate-dependent aminotransferase [Pseudomonadota bacterium]MBU1542015.1 pyridoxal phosphate-dependent aminotransferase [Pseudomonadota bacterium]MBU2430969.1 pyridoxal phosphate-dependent aminotransferase [Pseudomonadota bacterium]MBU2480570.1 pyridoxal phosphate-dependent aminotransferase [Pseudomonadota bacterium]